MKQIIGTIFAVIIALGAGAATVYVSLRYLREPQNNLDWLTLIASALIAGLLAFFVAWGHFQSDPVPPANPADKQ